MAAPLMLADVLPNIQHTIDGTGFLFGAGTSLEAGYPLMKELTGQVVGALLPDERDSLDAVLNAAGTSYDSATASPNIEQLSDLVIAHVVNTGDLRATLLEQRLRDLIREVLLSVTSPKLDVHCRFLELLKSRSFGMAGCVWIFTTNYDTLFESAASQVGIPLENGFAGTFDRYFCPTSFTSLRGTASNRSFVQSNELTIKLVKLHGSLSWYEQGGRIYERHPSGIPSTPRRLMVLPRCKKVIDTLQPPYDSLFSVTSRVLGTDCRYLVSCGFGYCDEHLTQQLLVPVLSASKCRLFIFSDQEPSGISAFRTLPCVSGAFSTHSIRQGTLQPDATEFWKFSRFVELFV